MPPLNQLMLIFVSSGHLFLSALTFLIFLRVLLSFFASEESKFLLFCAVVTEPVVYPVRVLLSHIPALEAFPIDITYMATYLILMFVQMALPASF